MAKDWHHLAEDYAGSSILIGDVDCTEDGKELCEEYGVRGYPTIKYFLKDGDRQGEDYSGGRDYDSLKSFAEETLEAKCDVGDKKECTDKEKAYIEKMEAKSSEERASQLERLGGMKGKDMKADLKRWLVQRIRILVQLEGQAGEKEL